ncbi:hypothetical protein M3Y95_00272700 [Aphelenchoides besseyi]|nr:hypothetical protein M3Y95_00272700 [Aphelenchoides besseyi]
MTISILISDLCFTVFSRTHIILPVAGACLIGAFNSSLSSMFGLLSTFRLLIGLQVFSMISSLVSVCNATIFRYQSVRQTLNPISEPPNQKLIHFLMFFLQILWPLVGVLYCLNINSQPTDVIQTNYMRYPEIMNRTVTFPCIYLHSEFLQFVFQLRHAIPLVLNVMFCSGLAIVLLVFSFRTITKCEFGPLTKRSTWLQKRLLIGLAVQTIVPNFGFVCCATTLILSIFWGSNYADYLGHLALQIGSVHSFVNFLILFSIPAISKGLFSDVKYVFKVNRPRHINVISTKGNNLVSA